MNDVLIPIEKMWTLPILVSEKVLLCSFRCGGVKIFAFSWQCVIHSLRNFLERLCFYPSQGLGVFSWCLEKTPELRWKSSAIQLKKLNLFSV